MRIVLLVSAALIFPTGLALAQGTKDAPNYGTVGPKTQSAASEPTRPTTTRNIPTTALPSGTGIQRTYRDGKLQSFVR